MGKRAKEYVYEDGVGGIKSTCASNCFRRGEADASMTRLLRRGARTG